MVNFWKNPCFLEISGPCLVSPVLHKKGVLVLVQSSTSTGSTTSIRASIRAIAN